MYNKLTLKAILELAAPHTWPASIVPVILGAVLSISLKNTFSPLIFLCTLAVAILLQGSVNTINDYVDFIKGTDKEENCDDPNDASIVYNKIDPRHALYVGIVLIILAALAGFYVIYTTGWVPLVFGAIGVVVIALYSYGKTPISYLPIGELISGFVMGGLITLACYYAYTGILNFSVLYYAILPILTIGLIMMMNNTSDIERDCEAGRKTLPVLLGRKYAAGLLKLSVILSILLAAHMIFWHFRGGLFIIPVLIFYVSPPALSLLKKRISPEERMYSMMSIVNIHKRVNSCYIIAIMADYLSMVVR